MEMNETRTEPEPRLSYPTRWVTAVGGRVEEYIIPERDKAAVLEALYPFDPVPKLSETMYDLHEEKTFKVADFRVVRDSGLDMLVSPYFFQSGGTVIDWMPPDFKPGGFLRRKIRGSEGAVVTRSFGPKAGFCH
jgi:hypothetical protein